MKTFSPALALIPMLLVLTGCVDTFSPQGALKSAYQAAQDDNVEALRKTLAGAALTEFGTARGAARIRAAVAASDDLQISTRLVSSGDRNRDGYVDSRVFSARVGSVAAATVVCGVNWSFPDPGLGCGPQNPCNNLSPRATQSCRVSQLTLHR